MKGIWEHILFHDVSFVMYRVITKLGDYQKEEIIDRDQLINHKNEYISPFIIMLPTRIINPFGEGSYRVILSIHDPLYYISPEKVLELIHDRDALSKAENIESEIQHWIDLNSAVPSEFSTLLLL